MEDKDDCNKVSTAVSDALASGALRPAVPPPQMTGPHHITLPSTKHGGPPQNKLAFTLENVFSAAECQALMKAAESLEGGKGFRAAGLGGSGKQEVVSEFRSSFRLISVDHELCRVIWGRVRHLIPVVWKGRRVIGLNEHLKFLRYTPGQHFSPHFDGSFCRPGRMMCCVALCLWSVVSGVW